MEKKSHRQIHLIVLILTVLFLFYAQPLFALCDRNDHGPRGQNDCPRCFFVACGMGAPTLNDPSRIDDCVMADSASLAMANCGERLATVTLDTKLSTKSGDGNATVSGPTDAAHHALFMSSGVFDGLRHTPAGTIYLLNTTLRC